MFAVKSRLFHAASIIKHSNPLRLPRPVVAPKRQRIPNVSKIICVASGKGGVGKSTIAVNFAVGLAQDGKRVGLLDADLFGPSIPRMMKLTGEPFVKDNKFVPLANHGVKCMSMGFLVREADAVVWRGLMVMKAVQQLLWQVDWGELDVLVIDLPPGTGDVPLTIAQQVLVDGAIIVTTPQQVALSDVKRGIEMFKKLDIPIYGLVQNMSYFQCSKCSEKHYLFGGLEGCDSLGLKTLGSFPITPAIASEGDAGIPRGIKLDIQLE